MEQVEHLDHVIGAIPQETALAQTRPAGGQLATTGEAGQVMDMLRSMIAQKKTPDDVAAMRELVAMYKDLKAMDAKEAFFRNKAELSTVLPTIIAKKEVISKGVLMYTYAPIDEMLRQLGPFLKARGFDIGWNFAFTGTGADCRCVATMELTFGGHTQEYHCQARVKVSDSKASDLAPAQLDKQARTSACRGALAGAFNLDFDYDDDARIEGDVITPEQAANLKARVAAVGSDVNLFLRFAGADTFETIRVNKLEEIERTLASKEAKAQAKKEIK